MGVTLGFVRGRVGEISAWLDMLRAEELALQVALPIGVEIHHLFCVFEGWAPAPPGKEQPLIFRAGHSPLGPEKSRPILEACRRCEASLSGFSRDVLVYLMDDADVIVDTTKEPVYAPLRSGPLAGRYVSGARAWEERLRASFDELLAGRGPDDKPPEPAFVEEAMRIGKAVAPALELVRRHDVMLDVSW